MAAQSLVSWLYALFVTSASLCLVAAQEDLLLPRQDPHQNYFTNPPQASVQYDYQDDPAYNEGTKVNITWETGLPSVDLILCQPALDGTYGQSRLVANTSQRWFLWDVTYSDVTTLAGPVGNAFFFQFRPPAAAVPFYNSHYFNVTDPKPGSTTTSTTSASGTSTPSSTNTSSTTTSTGGKSTADTTGSKTGQSDSNSSSPSSSSNSSGISTGAVVAISICATLAVGALVALLTLILLRRRKKKYAKNNKIYITDTAMSSQSSTSIGGPPQELTATSPIMEIGSKPQSHEVETKERPVELEAEIVGQAM